MFSNDSVDGLGFQDSTHWDLLDILNTALDGYDLKSAIGPLLDPAPFIDQFENVSTTLGLMTLRSIGAVNFEAVTDAGTIPEPSTILLFGCGLIGLASATRKKLGKQYNFRMRHSATPPFYFPHLRALRAHVIRALARRLVRSCTTTAGKRMEHRHTLKTLGNGGKIPYEDALHK